jgi:hypothetical protein
MKPCVSWKKEKTEMAKKTIETTTNPQVQVRQVGNDLQVKGWDRPEVLAKSSSDNDLILEEQDGIITVSSQTDCVLYLPHEASIQIANTGTDARIRSVFGEISITNTGSNLALRDVGPVTISNVGTDFSAKRINGRLEIGHIGSSATLGDVGEIAIGSIGSQLVAKRVRGDLNVSKSVGGNTVIRDIDGQVQIKSVGGSLHLREVSGGISVDAGGNITAEFSPVSWQAYDLEAGGNLRCYLPDDINAELEITSGSRDIRVKTPEVSEKREEGHYTISLGEGAATVKLTAGGNVNVSTRDMDLEGVEDFDIDFGDEIGSMAEEIAEQASRQIEAQLEMIENNLKVHLSGLSTSLSTAGLSEEKTRELEERLEQARQRAAQRAEGAAQRAQQKIELKIAAAQRKAERKARASAARAARKERQSRGDYGFTVVAPPPPKPTEPVSEQERMMILQMLQDKKISVEQAEKLLAALEGKGV